MQFIFNFLLFVILDSLVFRFPLFQFAQPITGWNRFSQFNSETLTLAVDFPKLAKRRNEIKLRVLVIARCSFLFFGITSNPLDRWYVVSFIETDRCAHPRRYLCTCLAFYHRARLIFLPTPRASGDNLSPAASHRLVVFRHFCAKTHKGSSAGKCSDAVILVFSTLSNCSVLKKKKMLHA